jgi:hypothetical protein
MRKIADGEALAGKGTDAAMRMSMLRRVFRALCQTRALRETHGLHDT